MGNDRRAAGRRATAPQILFVLVGAILLGLTATAQAQAPQPGLANGFEIDGNLLSNNPGVSMGMGSDWLDGPAGPGSGLLFPSGVPKNPLVTWHFLDFVQSADQDIFGGSNKVYDNPNSYVWKTGSVPPKDDVQNGYVNVSQDAAGNYWLIIGGDRRAINGDSYIDFEFLQRPLHMNSDRTFSSEGPHKGRTVGDFLLTVKLRQGGSQAEFFAQEWVPDGKAGYTYADVPFPDGVAFVAANVDSEITTGLNTMEPGIYGINQFGEAAVNLTAILPEFGECYAIATVFVRTKSSASASAGLKDFITPFQLNHCIDEVPPQVTCPPDLTVPCGDPVHPSALGFPFVTDNCDDSPELTFVDTIVPGSCENEYTILRRWTAVDECDNTVECTQTIMVVDNAPPTVLGGPGPISVQCPADVPDPDTRLISATDDCGEPIITHLGDVSDGGSCPETITRTYLVDDGCGNTAQFVQLITIHDTTPPDIQVPDNITLQCVDEVPAADVRLVTALDNCGSVTVIHVGDESDKNSCPEIITRAYRAIDACGNASNAVQIITIDDDTPPEITGPEDITIQCRGEIPQPDTGAISAVDNCSGVSVSHVGDVSDGNACPERITRTYRAVDGCGNAADHQQVITIHDQTPPDIVGPGDIELQCDADVVAADVTLVRTTDNCGNVTVAHVADVRDGSTCPETISRTYRATDDCGNSADWVQIIRVHDHTPPAATCPQDITVGCARDVPLPDPSALSVSDNCGGVTVLHMGDFSDRRTCPETISRVYRVTDGCGNAVECTQKISIMDVTPPEITKGIGPIRVQCRDEVPPPAPGLISARDECGEVRIVHVGDQSDNASCPEQITRTYRAYDDCNNFTDFTQTITVHDETPPQIVSCPASQMIECPELPLFGTPVAEDNCDPLPDLIVTQEDSLLGSEPWTFSATRTWVAVDYCGNVSDECTQTITFKCEVDALCTHTQGFYANYGGKFNGYPTIDLIRAALSTLPLVIGTEARSLTIHYASADCIIQRLPAGTTPVTLPYTGNSTLRSRDCLPHPKELPLDPNGKFENVLLGQTITLGLNMRLSPALFLFPLSREFCTQRALPGPDGLLGTPDDVLDTTAPIGHFEIAQSVLNAVSALGLWPTVQGLYQLANRALGGANTAGATLSQINDAVDAINRGFDGCRFIVPCRSKTALPPDPWASATLGSEEDSEEPMELGAPLPTEFRLGQNYPNPFNPSTRITIAVPIATPWSLTVYNVAGQSVRRFEGSTGGAAFVHVDWNGTDEQGRPVAAGMYFYRLQAATFTDVRKMILLK